MESQDEIWKDVVGWEGLYQISSYGRVKSLPKIDGVRFRGHSIILKQKIQKTGYCCVQLNDNKNRKPSNQLVHRMVALHFIQNPKNLPQVNHIDFNKQNNYTLNLEWASPKENTQHAIKNGVNKVYGSDNGFSKITEKEAVEIFLSKERLIDLSKKYGLSVPVLSKIRRREAWVRATEHLSKSI